MSFEAKRELTLEQFNLIAKLIKSRDPAKRGARLVLVEGMSNTEAYTDAGISPQSLSNTLGRYRKTKRDIEAAFLPG